MLKLPFKEVSQSILLMGLARSGMATLQWLREQKITVYVWDQSIECMEKACQLGAKPFKEEVWLEIEALIVSPGIPLSNEIIEKAKVRDIPVFGDCDIFREVYSKARFIGVTGTNGKSTTSALIYHLLQQAKMSTAIGGNFGIPVFSLPALDEEGTYVIELSSFQLDLSTSLDLNIAVWLNISEDHLDRHGNMAAYVAAKTKIFKRQRREGINIVSIDDHWSQEIYKQLLEEGQQTVAISTKQALLRGLYVHDGWIIDNYYETKKPILALNTLERLPGLHNAQNVLAAYGAGRALGLKVSQIQAGLMSFPGLAHRQEWLGKITNITFVNDSKGTNSEAVAKALDTFENIYWIAGGVPKSNGIDDLKSFFPKIKEAFLIGQAQEAFAQTLHGHVQTHNCQTLENAVKSAFIRAQADGQPAVILLSPACASYDQFKDFEERGECFRQYVAACKEGAL